MNSTDRWFNGDGANVLRRTGLKRGQTVLDFGCGSGHYAIPAAQVIGREAVLYALDRNSYDLKSLTGRAKSLGLDNIVVLQPAASTRISLDDEMVDTVLLYDVLHHYFYPHQDERRKLLAELWRVLRPNGILSLFPTHLDSYMEPRLADIEKEIEDAHFRQEMEYRDLQMMHDGGMEKGRVITFRKQQLPPVTGHRAR
jgi:SAM-dependent methyltransferase